MIELQIDTKLVEKTLRIMIARIGRFSYNMGTEMSDWQTQDMHRKKPFTKRNVRGKLVYTVVRPHSRKQMMRSRKIARRQKRRGIASGRRSMRPILRAELEARLAERMKDIMEKRLQWAVPSSSGDGDGG